MCSVCNIERTSQCRTTALQCWRQNSVKRESKSLPWISLSTVHCGISSCLLSLLQVTIYSDQWQGSVHNTISFSASSSLAGLTLWSAAVLYVCIEMFGLFPLILVNSHIVNSHFVNFTLSILILSTSNFVNSHFVNIDHIGIDQIGIDKVRSWQSE